VGDQVANDDAQGFSAHRETRGDRLFMGLLSRGLLNLAFVGSLGSSPSGSIWSRNERVESALPYRGHAGIVIRTAEHVPGNRPEASPGPLVTNTTHGRHFDLEVNNEMRYTTMAWPLAVPKAPANSWGREAEAKKWIDSEFQPSTAAQGSANAEMKVCLSRRPGS